MTTPATQTLAECLVNACFENLPPDVVEKAKLCLMDSVGCFFGGHQTPVAPGLERLSADIAGGSANPPRPDPAWHAFQYATLANALDLDDIYWKGHPGATVVAAALAVANRSRSTGRDLIAAIVAGYEVGCRIGMSLRHNRPRKAVHGHGTWQIFGAAAASAKLLKLDHKQAAHALAIAAVNAPVASVMKTVYGAAPTMAKNNFATAAMGGVNAAFLARAGFEGPLDVFEGDTGFWRMAGADGVDLSQLKIGPGIRYEIQDVGFKAFSCCRIIQSSVELPLRHSPSRLFTATVMTSGKSRSSPPRSSAVPRSMIPNPATSGRPSSAHLFQSPWACSDTLPVQDGSSLPGSWIKQCAI